MFNTKNQLRSSDRNDFITNVPAIISTSASPIETVPLDASTNLLAPFARSHCGMLLKSSDGEHLSFETDVRSLHAPRMNQQPSKSPHTRSDELAHCTKCDGLTIDKLSNSNVNYSKTKQSSESNNQIIKKGNDSSSKRGSIRHECITSCSSRSVRNKSYKSSQNSLREHRNSRKDSIFPSASPNRDTNARKSKKDSKQYGGKTSSRGPNNLHKEQDSETREILLGDTTCASHSKFDRFSHEIKIPEPVEAVR